MFISAYDIYYTMGTYTTQISFGALQYERLQKWIAREKYSGKTDIFVRDKFMALLDQEVPE